MSYLLLHGVTINLVTILMWTDTLVSSPVCVLVLCFIRSLNVIAAEVSGQEKDQAKQIFTSSAASGILTNDLVKILQDEKVCVGISASVPDVVQSHTVFLVCI